MSGEMTEPETQVAVFLDELGLEYRFEFPISIYEDNERFRIWYPDFFLPELMLHVEVCGSEQFDYSFRKKMYVKNKVGVIFVHFYKGPQAWKPYLVDRLEHFGNERRKSIYEALNLARNLFEEKASRSESLESLIGDAPPPVLIE